MSKRSISEVEPETFSKKPRLDEVDYHALVLGHIVSETSPTRSVMEKIDIEELVCSNLMKCDIGGWVYTIPSLKRICIDNCKYVVLAKRLPSTSNLKVLKIENSSIKYMPRSFGCHANFEKLSIHNCNLEMLEDDFFTKESGIKVLKISNCQFYICNQQHAKWDKLPSSLTQLQHLEKLCLEDLDIDFPAGVEDMKSLKFMRLKKLCLSKIPSMQNLKQLKKLSFRDCFNLCIEKCQLLGLESLESLDVGMIRSFEDKSALYQLPNLRELTLSNYVYPLNNETTCARFKNLTDLTIIDYQDEYLPPFIHECVSLKHFTIHNARLINALPINIFTNLPQLISLRISETPITNIPVDILAHPNIWYLQIGKNSWTTVVKTCKTHPSYCG